jgi:hypothetical protein
LLASPAVNALDLVVRHADELWLYEIKTTCSVRGCLRQAVGQLLEYSLWPDNDSHPPVGRLIVVGECPLDDAAAEYLDRLNNRFPLPIAYQHLEPVYHHFDERPMGASFAVRFEP